MREDLRYIESLIEDKEHFSCPTDKELANFIDGESSNNELIEHLAHCYNCREVVYEVIEYKKKSKPFNNTAISMSLVALVASLVISVYVPSDVQIGMIDLSEIGKGFKSDVYTVDKIVDGDKFIKEISKNITITNLEIFNQAQKESNFDDAIGLYQETINSIPEDIDERIRLKRTIFIRYKMLELATKEDNKLAIESYKSIIIENIREYYLLE